MPTRIADKLIAWYARRKRSLPWRDDPQPYAVWVAEIMAQQTRLEAMLPYYARWMARFPTVEKLAAASEQDVLNIWEGLGYYGRARNLHKAARLVVDEYNGQLPGNVEALMKLPGIGRYTAGAIASLAFGRDEPAVDGNALRVLTRLFDVQGEVGRSATTRQVWALAEGLLPKGRAAEFNQALMDLGASLCAPQNPDCEPCPLRADCQAYALGVQEGRPVRAAKKALPRRDYAALVLRRGEQVLIRQRPAEGLLGGLWEFPNLELSNPKRAKAALRKGLGPGVNVGKRLQVLEHTYSHFRARLVVYVGTGTTQGRWVRVDELADYPMGKLDRGIADSLTDVVG